MHLHADKHNLLAILDVLDIECFQYEQFWEYGFTLQLLFTPFFKRGEKSVFFSFQSELSSHKYGKSIDVARASV